MAFRNSNLQEHFDNILDTFTGADGGVKFVLFKSLLADLERRLYDEDDQIAGQLLELVNQFSRFIDSANTDV